VHEWLPAALAREAMRWLEVVAMQQGRRPRTAETIASVLADERSAASALEAAGALALAERRYAAIVSTFEGLADVADAKARAEAIARLPAFARARKDERSWDEWEARSVSESGRRLVALHSNEVTPVMRQALLDLQIPHLESRASRDTYEGRAAARVLAWIFTQASFYMWRELVDAGSWQRATFFQQLALEIEPDAPVAHYRLALTYLGTQRRDQAMDALRKAVVHGFPVARLADDPALAPLREDPAFKALLAR
jgi:hypothetical protein